jgi:shikimate dehydrogenase
MIVYGLIGYPLKHSASAMLFREKFEEKNLYDRNYRLYPIQNPELVRDLVKGHPGIAGLNVTIPFKEKIIPYLDALDPVASEIGAVNTISISRMPKRIVLTGYNTDAGGFALSADFSGFKSALILGTGGSARAVSWVLRKAEINCMMVSRSSHEIGQILYSDINEILVRKHPLIINASPCGMYPHSDACPPIPYEYLTPRHFLYDLIYNPECSLFLKKGKEMGCRIQNGMEMLRNQAELSYRIWTTS